jgi:hypothetical protein
VSKQTTLKQIEEALLKAEKFDNIKQRDMNIAKKLMDMAKLCNDIAHELDPYIKSTERRAKGFKEEIAMKVLALMQEGREFFIEQVEQDHNISYGDAQQVIAYLCNHHNVKERRDQLGSRKKLFYLEKPTR